MKHKILVADDSLTIQKVIKITLASEPFDLIECTDAKDLIQTVKENKPNIVLLDFNLSEDKTGYDLANDIKSLLPTVKILMLFGTFDTIDESLLSSSGVAHKIVKPFDGTKFINLCRVMAQDLDLESADSIHDTEDDFSMDSPLNMPEKIEEVEEDDDQWVMDSPDLDDEEEESLEIEVTTTEDKELNPLQANMQDWGMDVPGVIGGASDHVEIPGVIDDIDQIEMKKPTIEQNSSVEEEDDLEIKVEQSQLPSSDDLAFPDDDDLAYPDMDDLGYPDEIELETPTKKEPKSKLVPLETLEEVNEEEPVVEVETKVGGTETDDDLESLKAQIEDEVEEDDLWSADEYENSVEEESAPETQESEHEEINLMNVDDLPHIEPHNLHEVKNEFDQEDESEEFDDEFSSSTPDDFPDDVMEEEDKAAPQTVNMTSISELPDDLEERLKEKLAPLIEEFIKEYCKENIERIAWEVIPDLAENLIKKEIKKISNSVLNS